MNKWTFFLIVIVLILGSIVWLVNYTLDERSLIGAYVLGTLTAVAIALVDWGKTNITVWLRDKQYDQQFQANMRENLAIATQSQKLLAEQQKAQNSIVVSEDSSIGLLFDHSENYNG